MPVGQCAQLRKLGVCLRAQPTDDALFWKTTKRWLPELEEKNSPSNAGMKRARIVFLSDWDTLARVFDDWVLDAQVQVSDPRLHPPKAF